MRPVNLGQHVLTMIGNLYFAAFVAAVLIFTIIAATYEQFDEPFFHPSNKFTTQIAFTTFINITDEAVEIFSPSDCEEEIKKPIECNEPQIFHMMMRSSIEKFNDIHFYRFGKPISGSDDNTCDMAWRYKLKNEDSAAFHKDYRRFVISRWKNCSISVASIGEYHTGVNARKTKKKKDSGFPVVDDTLPVVESHESFSQGKYLIYSGGGDRCKNMKHYLWSFVCALAEARYLNRTLVMDLSLCLSSIYTKNNLNEEGKDFRYYFDFEHLKNSVSVLDQDQFWADWKKWRMKDSLTLRLVENIRITPMKLKNVKDTLIMRKLGNTDKYSYKVCEAEAESVIQRPWQVIRKSRRLMDIVSAITTKLNHDYDSVRVLRGEKARNTDALLSELLQDKVEEGRDLYISTNETDVLIFDQLKDKYTLHFLDDYKELWDENSEWYLETSKINGYPVEFDGYMRISVDTEVLLRSKQQVKTFTL